jgi:hypothetical protein
MTVPMSSLGFVVPILLGATPAPFAVRVVEAQDSFWTIASTLASIAVAACTLVLAVYTRSMAAKTAALAAETVLSVNAARDATAATELQHQEALVPILQYVGTLIMHERPGATLAELKYRLSNIGLGPAIKILIQIEPDNLHPWSAWHDGLAAGSTLEYETGYRYEQLARSQHNVYPYRVRVSYRSIFGDEGTLVMRSMSGQGLGLELEESSLPGKRIKNATIVSPVDDGA